MVDLWVYVNSWKDQDAAQDITTVQGRTMQRSGKQRDLQQTESHIVGDESTEDCFQKTKRWCHKEFSARATYALVFDLTSRSICYTIPIRRQEVIGNRGSVQ